MGEHETRTKDTTKATIEAKQAPRPSSAIIGKDIDARILKADVVGGGTLLTLAAGASHGVHRGMTGYVKQLLADVVIEDVHIARCTAYVDVTPDELKNRLYVVINPTSKPRAPSGGEPRVIYAAVEGGRTTITISRGSAHGIGAGARGTLHASDGREGESFFVESVTSHQAFASIVGPVDHVTRHPSVRFDVAPRAEAPIQRRGDGALTTADPTATAQAGIAGASQTLPFFEVIQRSFGKHDISNVRSQVGGDATAASDALGARAYAMGDRVAFASTPDLHTAAHEAAHTIQQRHGAVGLQGLGAADDEHERHADIVADAVVNGRSAEPLLDSIVGGNATTAIQRKAHVDHRKAYVAPERVELIADGLGRLAKTRVAIGVRAPKGSGPTVVVSATPEVFKVIAAPNILPTVEEMAPEKEIVVGFGTPQRGTFAGSLAIRAQSPGVGDLHIPMTGYTDKTLVPVSAPTERRLDIPSTIDIGSHVVGSDLIYSLARLRLDAGGAAVVHPIQIIDTESLQSKPRDNAPLVLHEDRAAAFRRSSTEELRITDTAAHVLDIVFAPTRAGFHKALIEIPITWADGVTTKQYVWISGRARAVTEARGVSHVVELPSSARETETAKLQFTGDARHDFGLIAETAGNTAASIAERQREGLRIATEASRGYKPKPPPPSILLSIVETALTIANASLARFFAGKIAAGIASDAARTLSDGAGTQMIKERAKAELAAISEPIREGLKHVGKTQFPKVKEALTSSEQAQVAASGFWELQHRALLVQSEANRQMVTNAKYRLMPMLAHQPDAAFLAMSTTLRALEATKAQAIDQQLLASLSQYLVAVAASHPGRESDPIGARLATAREHGANYSFNYKHGIVQIDSELRGESLHVNTAKITGVSRLVIERLGLHTLLQLPVPMIIAVRSSVGSAVITRDGGGVLRVSGRLPGRQSADVEANNVERAERLLEMLATSDTAKGITIEHDDVGEHTEQAR